MKFSALNREASSSSTLSTPSSKKGAPTQEAQESACLQLYHTAMKHQQDGEMEKAKSIYREILESEIMELVCSDGSASIATNTILKLKYLIYKNFASIARDQGDLSAAVDAYIEASKVDTSDITMWCHLSSAASSLGNLLLARKALEQALCCNGEYWPAIEALCSVLLALEDFHSCLVVVDKGLQLDPNFPRGLVFLNHIFERCPDIFNYQFSGLRLHLMKPCPPDRERFLREVRDLSKKRESLHGVIVVQDPISPPKKLDHLTISSLGSWLLATYNHCKEMSKKDPSYTVEVDLSTAAVMMETADERPTVFSSPQKKTCPSTSTSEEPPSSNSVAATSSTVVSVEEGASAKKESRKRLLESMEDFAPKRRSNRVKSKRRDVQQVNHFDVLKKYLPSWLMLSELPEIIELSPLVEPRAKKKDVSEKDKQVTVMLETWPKLNEKETARDFLSEHQHNYGIINLLYKFVEFLALHYSQKWDGASWSTAKVFVDIYEHLHKHLCYPSPFCSIKEAQETEFTNMAMIALTYVELYLDQVSSKKAATGISGGKKSASCESGTSCTHPKCFNECLVFVEQCAGLVGAAGRERATFSLRVQWCVVKWRLLLKNNDDTIAALERCERLLTSSTDDDELMQVCLPNCKEGQVISLAVVQEQRQQLEQSTSIKKIHSLFANEDYVTVVDKLLPLLDEESSSALMEFLLGSESSLSNESTGLSLLLQSLLKLKRYYSCLQSAVQALLHLLWHCKLGNNKWYTSIWDSWNALNSCLTFDEQDKKEILEKTDLRLLKRLVICILKTMDTCCTAADAPVTSNMPVCLPWKILYIVLSNKWKVGAFDKPSEDQDETMEHTGLPQPSATLVLDTSTVAMEHDHENSDDQQLSQTPTTQNSSGSEIVASTCTSLPAASSPEPQQLALSLRYLKEAHDYLGNQGWCCRDAGCFLLTSVDALRAELKVLTKLPLKHREMLFLELEQCYYCLYGYPYKKAKTKGLADHESDQVPLKWESALMLMEYYHPTHLPSIDDTKQQQITADLIQLYMNITEVVPEHGKVLSEETLTDYIEGELEQLPKPSPPHQQSSLMSELYYLLADDYLKSGDNHKALRNYLSNLCYCPDWFDSWAGLALARSRLIVKCINSRVFKSGTENYIQKQTAATVRCFKKAVSLNSKHCYIIEKFGLFCYCVQSFASQILRQPNVFSSEELCTWASTTRREMLQLSETCFTDALQLEGTLHAEPWIYHFMLGKIGPKLHRPVGQSLQHFTASAEILHKEGAGYPDLVELAAKHHAVQAIEVHYQLFSTALKNLLNKKLEDKKEREKSISEIISKVQSLPLGSIRYPSLWSWLCEVIGVDDKTDWQLPDHQLPSLEVASKERGAQSKVGEEEQMDVDVTSDHDTSFDRQYQSLASSRTEQRSITVSTASDIQKEYSLKDMEAITPKPMNLELHTAVGRSGCHDNQQSSDVTHEILLVKCLYGVSVCAVRCPAYFKPMYRIAKALLSLGLAKLARDILLGPLPAVLGELQDKLLPLFVLKANIFSNMWQIPAEEINRPGNFSTHARKNLNLLLLVLSNLREAPSLLFLAQHLRSKPDANKQYLRENERISMYKKAVKLCVHVLKAQGCTVESMGSEEATKLKATAVLIRPMALKLDSSNQNYYTKTVDEAIVRFSEVIDKESKEEEPAVTSQDIGEREHKNNSKETANVAPDKEVAIDKGTSTSQETTTCNEKQLTQQPAALNLETAAMDTTTDNSKQQIQL